MTEKEIWQTASVMVKRYPDTAEFETALRADECGLKGDPEGQRVWIRVRVAIRTLVNTPADGPLN